ncbi:MAG: hypothetical protein E7631_05840 [Ruminococcaceae bacterium]|nr:hypothetical protein [Oscillospiraceae bacterium]
MNLYAIDALGRKMPENVPAPRENRLVGMFYFLWLGEHGRHKPYDISKILAADPDAGYKPDSDVWGSVGTYHHWGEPFYGYYYSDDEWVIRRHMKLLTQAGVDFLFFDTTNAVIYEKNVKIVLKVLSEYTERGLAAPKVMFYTNTASGETVQRIYNSIYKPGYCENTWFRMDGKPVIIAVPEECSPETRAFFNIKLSQWPNEADKAGGWPWMDFVKPQRAFPNLNGVPEVINVSVAQHPQIRFGDSAMYGETANCGRSYHGGREDKFEGSFHHGFNFAEQFERALEADVPVTLVTGWNEWIAGRWPGTPERPIMFVDCANYEYSRDIEMMRDGYFDNYYLQLCGYIRRLKGMEADRVYETGQQAVYAGYGDGNMDRCHPGYDRTYENRTGRNAIAKLTLSHKPDALIVKVETEAPIDTSDRTGAYMRLYLTVGEKETWGYDYVICPTDTERCLICAAEDGIKPGAVLAVGNFSFVTESLCHVKIPFDAIGITGDTFRVCCKAADARCEITKAEDFYDTGDCLPMGRADVVYRGKR